MGSRNPASILFNSDGYEVAVNEDGYIESTQPGFLVAGRDADGNVKFFNVNSDGSFSAADSRSRTVLGEYYFGTPLITGAASSQNLLTLENPSGSGNIIYLSHVRVNGTVSATFTTPFIYSLSRTDTFPSGGSLQTAQKQSTSDIAPEGIIRVLPTVTSSAGSLWTGSPGILTASGGFFQTLNESIAIFKEYKEIVIAPGEAVVVTAGTNSADWSHWINIQWNEVMI